MISDPIQTMIKKEPINEFDEEPASTAAIIDEEQDGTAAIVDEGADITAAINDEEEDSTAAIVDDIKMSLTLLSNILDYKHSDSPDNMRKISMEKENVADDIIGKDEESKSMVELKDKLKENDILKREIVFLKQQLLKKEKKIKKMEFIFGYGI